MKLQRANPYFMYTILILHVYTISIIMLMAYKCQLVCQLWFSRIIVKLDQHFQHSPMAKTKTFAQSRWAKRLSGLDRGRRPQEVLANWSPEADEWFVTQPE